ncbi:Carboxylesterase [Apodospora peruviana]|uniref:Carboxylic ester hydrolase n=1 Tax=Apodospora peruviana TaxID=516989 RepID=A0AAE0I3Z2_9PEZI|nr:Carboxylesterase [Apodospora peruviana]
MFTCGHLRIGLLGLLLPAGASCAGLGLPTVDLVTSVHVATLNAPGDFYSFDNIPYAEPPVGQLRFRAPIPKVTVNRTVNDGSVSRICSQANGAAWLGISVPFMLEQLLGPLPGGGGPGGPAGPDPRESEDCLYLNVKTPRAVFDQGRKNLPVLVWIHGGGFTAGSKDEVNPAGLIAQGMRDGKSGFVYVAINYRLGLFGFPPRGPRDWDTATNAGLYDQRLALRWVELNIHRFGGDPRKVTVIGESAGGSSIAIQLAAFYGIDGTAPFNRAIIQSPAMRPATDAAVYAQVYQQVLSTAGVASIDALRGLPTAQLQGVNLAIVGGSSFAHFTFGPNVDGLLIPSPLPTSLVKGRVDRNVEVIAAYNIAEGLLFTDPRVQDNTAFKDLFSSLMPSIPAAKVNTLATTIYPEDFSGAQPYRTQTERMTLAISESLILCNAFALHLAYQNQSRAYEFSVFPGIHASDVSYTFFNGGDSPTDSFGVPINTAVAQTMQRYFADFAMVGAGPGSSANAIPLYTALARTLNITDGGNAVVTDPAANRRCRFWVEGLYS